MRAARVYINGHLFSFFANMLAEGHNLAYQAGLYRLDPLVYFIFNNNRTVRVFNCPI